MSTTRHESETITVSGLKSSLQKLKTDKIDVKADKATTLAGYGITDSYTKTEVNGLVDTPHQEYVTVENYASLPATGSADTVYRVKSWDGSADGGQGAVDDTVYSEYAWDDASNPAKYVFLCVKSQIGEVFDITVYNNNTKYADLAAALGINGANIPQSLQKGGMRIQFVRSSDNKYTQFRLKTQTFSSNPEDWYFEGDETLVENPEFVAVYLDANDKILFGVQKNGNIYFGCGVPQQVIDYVEGRIADLSLDEDEDIVAFLGDLITGDKTLAELLNEKVDKEEGKSLIDEEYAEGVHYIENPEFVYVKTDREGKILWAIKIDGGIYYGAGCPQQVKDYIEEKIAELSLDEYEDIVEFLNDYLGSDTTLKTIIDGINDTKVDKEEGKSLIDKDVADRVHYEENPEHMRIETDADDKILGGRKADGKKFEEVGFETPNLSIGGAYSETIDDPENRMNIGLDRENKVINYRDKDGVLHEKVGIDTPVVVAGKVNLSEVGVSDLIQTLKQAGFDNTHDWSDSDFVEIPIPTICAIVNIETDHQAEEKGLDIPTHIQFWDKNGNYFRKPILLNAQGSSSMSYHIKNQAIDINDGSEIKFGTWPAFDSFHIKKYFIDVFRGQCIVGYWLTEQVYQTKPYGEKRPWNYLDDFNDIDDSNGSFAKDFDSGAMAHPDGFPVHLFFNGNDAGIYTFNIKKARGNYNMKKDKQKQIILDGILGSEFFTANGNMGNTGALGENLWHDFEIRNPKISTDIDGNKYDGDNPKEPSNGYTTTKAAIARLTTAITAVNAESTDADKKAKFAEFFNVPFFIDYELISQVIYNYDGYRKNWIWCTWDGDLWCPTSYDMDSIFGQDVYGVSYVNGSDTQVLGQSNNIPTGTNLLKGLYQSELRARYKELRDKGILSVENIIKLMEKWVNTCGYHNLKSDIEDIVTSPYIVDGDVARDSNGKPILVPNTPSYRDGEKSYVYPPSTGGWYNSILRVKNWLEERIVALDSYYHYN